MHSIIAELFDRFKNEKSEFETSLGDDTKGLLQLYEASFLLMRGEDTLELAREFSTKCLKEKIENEGIDRGIFMDEHLSILVHQALELPLHWSVLRRNTRWFINAYEIKPNMNLIVLELAKLDFNIVQATHQGELKQLSRWWEQKRLSQKMPFARDRLWADLCRTYLQEATWHSMGYKPKLQEYINNAWISISAPVILTHAYFFVTYPIDNHAIKSLYEYHNIIRCSSIILRLANDLGTSLDEMKRGDVPKAIQCYMNESGASVDESQDYVRFLIHETWKEMNEEREPAICAFQKEFVTAAVELGRMAQYVYQYGDSHGMHFPQMKESIMSSLFEPAKL
ncbi:monoterpene synthase-like protein [Striga asiatica]|uniref:Monoterpene synthase-like protein n=1 Tax=Striga asiatica TaxID=4170 RepID=A0A5A7QAE5_STRAF|nr:monoterpene synthase-like protein [Striga asiatica]